jgi:alpha-beta hydrolase superfamily lysophospholipase
MRTGRAISVLPALLCAAALTACAEKAAAPEGPQATPPEGVLSVGIVVPDGTVLNGRLFGDGNDAMVILAHMRPNDQTAWFPFAEELARNGYAALTFDFRGYGISEGEQDFDMLDDDLAAAFDYMEARGNETIFLVGASMGGTTSLIVAAERDVAGVVSISAPSEFQGHDARDAIAQIEVPRLLIASEDDTAARVSLEELLEAGGTQIDTETYTGAAHGTNLFESEHAAALRERILEFLDENS